MKRTRGWQHDWLTGTWNINCGCCNEPLEGATRTMLALIYKYHTKKECLGGW